MFMLIGSFRFFVDLMIPDNASVAQAILLFKLYSRGGFFVNYRLQSVFLHVKNKKGAVANARRLQATASFFTPFPSLFLKAILNRSESSGFYRVGIVFGYA
ncbi:MAG: hypothetical protein IKH31_04450, partial [Clostridia bacterium]|nr:hypothetical protein [Clostridia bacterium]